VGAMDMGKSVSLSCCTQKEEKRIDSFIASGALCRSRTQSAQWSSELLVDETEVATL
jgi:hypothetical protein